MKPTVSAILPAYNAQDFLAEAIHSVLTQTYKEIEIIVVDDGSKDDTANVARSFGSKVQLHSQTNGGAASARNKGVGLATGEFVAFLDADDLWLPEKIEMQLAAIGEGDGFNYTDRRNFGALGALAELQSDSVRQHAGMVFAELLTEGNFVTASSVLMPRQWCLDLGGFNTSKEVAVVEDWDLWLRSAKSRPVSFCPTPLVNYRIHTKNITKSNVKQIYSAQEKVIASLFSPEEQVGRERETFKKARVASALNAGFFAANDAQWTFALKCYLRAMYLDPTKMSTYKSIIKCLLRRA